MNEFTKYIAIKKRIKNKQRGRQIDEQTARQIDRKYHELEYSKNNQQKPARKSTDTVIWSYHLIEVLPLLNPLMLYLYLGGY